jgi:hypothetical protein
VTRTGDLSKDVSVYYETVDLTANAGEDYTESHNRLVWPAQNSDVKQIKVSITKNPEVAEGQESFEVLLSSPAPSDAARLGEYFLATVLIEAKDADVDNKNDKVARITVRVLKPLAEVSGADGETMKAAFRKATSSSIDIEHNQIYFDSNAITARGDSPGTVMLTFELLPDGASNDRAANDLASDFMSAVSDPESGLYSDDMRVKCPVDITFQPEFRIVYTSPQSNSHKAGIVAAVLVPVFLLCITAACYIYRRPLRDQALRKLAAWRFEELAAGEGGVTTNVMHQMADRVKGVFSNRRRQESSAWGMVRDNDGDGENGDDHHFSLGDIDDDGGDLVRGGGKLGYGGGFASASAVQNFDDGTELVVVKRDDTGGEGDNSEFSEFSEHNTELMKKKRIIQIEL